MWEHIFWNFEKGNICHDLQKNYLGKVFAFEFRSWLAYCPLFTGYPVYTHLVTFFQVSAQKAESGVWKGCGEISLGVPTRVSSPRTVECRVVSVSRVSHDTTLLSVTPLLGPVVVPLGHHICIHMQGTGTLDTHLAFDQVIFESFTFHNQAHQTNKYHNEADWKVHLYHCTYLTLEIIPPQSENLAFSYIVITNPLFISLLGASLF